MTDAKRDENRVTTLIGVSSIDNVTPTLLKANPATGALLIDKTSLDAEYLKLDASNDPITGDLTITPIANSATTFQIFKQDGTTPVLNVDTTNTRIGIGVINPSCVLDVRAENAVAIKALSGDSAKYTFIQVGRAAAEASFAIVSQSGQFASGSVGGDSVLRVDSSAKKLHLGAGSGAPALSLTSTQVGINTTSPTYDLSFGGGTARTIGMERNTASETGGLSLTISGSGATSGSTDKEGGQLILSAGIGTGNASNNGILFRNPLPNASGTTDQALQTFLIGYAQNSTDFRLILNNTSTGSFGHGLSIGGQRASTIAMVRQIAADTAGSDLTIQSGGAASGATNKASGNLYIKTGISTGTARSAIVFQTSQPTGSGTSDQSFSNSLTIFSSGVGSHYANIGTGNTQTGAVVANSFNVTGQLAGGFCMYRNTTADTAGNNLTIQAGGATSASTNKGGGGLDLCSGISTGSGNSAVRILTSPVGSSGTGDNALSTTAYFGRYAATTFSFILNNTTTGYHGHGISIHGNVAGTVGLVRNTTADTAGNSLTIKAGGATSGSTDKAGGALFLDAGTSTGSARGLVMIRGSAQSGSGTTDNALAQVASFFATADNSTYVNLGTIGGTSTGAVVANSFNVSGMVQGGFCMYRHTTANTAGNDLYIQSGGATSGATDKAGGLLRLMSGKSTGTGTSQMLFQTCTPAGSTNTTDNAYATRLTIDNAAATFVPKVIAPTIKLTTGATNGAILVSDANGDATWQSGSWITAAETWTYVSADGNTGVFNVNADVTGILWVGMRVKYTQTTVKYGIITAIGAFSGGNTPVTIWGGTDYTFANAAVSLNYYSSAKAPQGFPMEPAKWTVEVTDTTARSQATPTASTWYNIGTTNAQITIPIGSWDVSYDVLSYAERGSAAGTQHVALSTTNNSASDASLQSAAFITLIGSTGFLLTKQKNITLAAKTLYYLNSMFNSTGCTTLQYFNSSSTMVIRAVCAYL